MTSPSEWAVDTSVAVPLLVASHVAHAAVRAWAHARTLHLCGHAVAETYAVLTRLPGDARVTPEDAVALIDDHFPDRARLTSLAVPEVHRTLAKVGVAGGASYDGLVALAAKQRGLVLVTRDSRARASYEAVNVTVHMLPT